MGQGEAEEGSEAVLANSVKLVQRLKADLSSGPGWWLGMEQFLLDLWCLISLSQGVQNAQWSFNIPHYVIHLWVTTRKEALPSLSLIVWEWYGESIRLTWVTFWCMNCPISIGRAVHNLRLKCTRIWYDGVYCYLRLKLMQLHPCWFWNYLHIDAFQYVWSLTLDDSMINWSSQRLV